MNKTVTVNLSGIVLHIDENAYEVLKQYLASIKRHFAESEGHDEIIADIESRIAEIFQGKLQESRQVIVMADVEEVMAAMGNPEDFGGAEESTQDKGTWKSYFQKGAYTGKRRLYRDVDDKLLGGVCSGISAYLDIDPVWLRLAFAISIFMFGTGFFLYIILWIIIPAARTTAEKLEMRGEKVNLENIEKTIKEEAENIKERFNNLKNEAKKFRKGDYAHHVKGFTGRMLELIAQLVSVFLQVILKIIGFVFVVVGLGVLFMVISMLTGKFYFSDFPVSSFFQGFFESGWMKNFSVIGIALIIGIPFFMLLYKGVRMLFCVKTRTRSLNKAMMCLWIIGLLMLAFVGTRIGSHFSKKEYVKQNISLIQPTNGTLYLDAPDSADDEDIYGHSSGIVFTNFHWHSYGMDKHFRINSVQMDIMKSNNGNFELVKIQSAHGFDKKDATTSAEKINYNFTQKDSLLLLNNTFNIDKPEHFRAQAIHLVLKVPVGKTIALSNNMKRIIYDIDNTTDTYDGDMVGHKWTMTESGLRCSDCDTFEPHEAKKHKRHRRDKDDDSY